jgi:hypothetical protein
MADKVVNFYSSDGAVVPIKAVDLGEGSYLLDTRAGKTVIASSELTRPDDVLDYAAGDAVANSTTGAEVLMMEFSGCARFLGGGGKIHKVRLLTDKKDDTSAYRLHLYSVAPAAASRAGDNVAFALLYADKANRVGYVDITALSTEDAATSTCAGTTIGLAGNLSVPFKCAAADTKLYGLLEIKSILTPAAQQKFFVELTMDQD